MNDDLLSVLACPIDRTPVSANGDRLTCASGHAYPVVQGVPVLLPPPSGEATLWVADASRRAAQGDLRDALLPGYWLETAGISDVERSEVVRMAAAQPSIDPLVSMLVAATNGILHRELLGRLPRYPIPELRLPPGNGKKLLDLGCSWGRWSIAGARLGYEVVGVDPSLAAVLAAKRVAAELGVRAQFVVADARSLPFAAESFDVAFSYSVLQHFAPGDVEAALDEVRRVLSPRGFVKIQMAHRAGLRSLYHQARRGFRAPSGFDVRYWSTRQLQRTFERRFAQVQVEAEGFLGLGMQPSDAPLLKRSARAVLAASELLRGATRFAPILTRAADSLYLSGVASS